MFSCFMDKSKKIYLVWDKFNNGSRINYYFPFLPFRFTHKDARIVPENININVAIIQIACYFWGFSFVEILF